MNIIKNSKRLVFKIGTSTLTHETGKLNLKRIELLVRILSDLKNSGKEIILVSSGAVSAGCAKLGLDSIPSSTEEKQAMAAVGQNEIMKMYGKFFGVYGYTVSQLLLTKHILHDEVMRKNAESTIKKLLALNCIPIVNENDSVSHEEIKFGGNDTLSAYVSLVSDADCLINLSDIDGLYDSDPRTNPDAKLISTVFRIDDTIYSYAGGAGSARGTGGMYTKIKAAEIVCSHGIPMFILNASNPEIIYDAVEGRFLGTYFMSY